MVQILLFIILGLAAGILSGFIGIGGGIIIVPALLFFFGFSQHQAQGTTLALMVPPIGILAAWSYYRQGQVDLRAALFICIGFVAGSVVGARFASQVSDIVLERTFGVILLIVAIKMIFAK